MKNQKVKRPQKSRAALVFLLSLVLCLCLAGCGNQGDSSSTAGSAGSAGSASSAAQEEGSTAQEAAVLPENFTVRDEDSRVFMEGSIGRWTTLPTYNVKDEEDVPYISARQYISMFYEKAEYSFENGILTVTNNGSVATIDTEKNVIRFEDSTAFAGPHAEGAAGNGIVEVSEFNQIRVSDKNATTESEGKPCEIDLNDYHLKSYVYGEDVLMPFLALQNTFGLVSRNNVLSYNGKDYFDVISAMDEIDKDKDSGESSPYIKSYYSGPFSKQSTCSQAYADYAYYTTCLMMDLTYGHKEEMGIDTFDAYFTKLKAKEAMTSTNPADTMAVESMLIYYLFDSGHDGMVPVQGVYGRNTDMKASTDAVEDIDLPENANPDKTVDFLSQVTESLGSSEATEEMIAEKGTIPSVTKLYAWSIFMSVAKPENYGKLRLDYSGDTAVIYFEAFMNDETNKYYLNPPTKADDKKSSFAYFYHCFQDIKKHDEVKNVVINLSNNGGGYASGLVSILGFMSPDGEVKITSKDLISDKFREEYYHVDTNLDGVFDDEDGFGGQYDFYIMTSGSSYSCGTALPFFAQKNGLAKVMGSKPGGGDCVVSTFVDAFGMHGMISGNMKLGVMTDKGFVSDEKAVKPDIKMMDSIIEVGLVPWFDADEIAKAVRKDKKSSKKSSKKSN